ncbi:hypothetical protein E4K72_01320 [Oxalobacteraceae bacterium OM1]|nr:hypothetical protein E4K72_01320 [Oxalobacteraceae bacterium OM1]
MPSMPDVAHRRRATLSGSARGPWRRVPRWLGATAAACLAFPAQAQVTTTLSGVSEYRFRGVSLSHGRAEPQLALGYDAPQGWYAGAFASGTDLHYETRTPLQLQGYGGYAHRAASSAIGWDVGVARAIWPGAGRHDYSEAYAGMHGDRVNARLWYSPNYFGSEAATLYAELNGDVPLWRQLHLQWHAGYLHALGNVPYPSPYAQPGTDLRIGLAAVMDVWTAQLAWVEKRRHADDYAVYDSAPSHAWVFSLSTAF